MVKLSFISPNYPTIGHYPLLIIIGFSFIFQSISHLYSMISYEYTIIKYKSFLSYFVLTYLILFYSVHCKIYIYIYISLSIYLYIYITFHLSIHPSSYISHWYSWRAWTLPLRPWPLGPLGLGRPNLSTSFRLHARGQDRNTNTAAIHLGTYRTIGPISWPPMGMSYTKQSHAIYTCMQAYTHVCACICTEM